MDRKIEMLKDFKYKRIIILGGSGSGKSTLAKRISLYTEYPVFHLDEILLNSDWNAKDKDKREELSQQFLSKDEGIVEGNYLSCLPNRIKWSDLIIFIKVSNKVTLYRILRRAIRCNCGLEENYGVPKGSHTGISISFIFWALKYNNSLRDKILSILKPIKDKKTLIIKNPKKLDIKKLLEE